MYTIDVEHEFCAAHALSISGSREPIHGHNFRVHAVIATDELDNDGLVCDFHTALDTLKDICAPYTNNNLNDIAPFDKSNPTAELLARFIHNELADRLDGSITPARVASVSVSEAPGCVATYNAHAR